MYNSQEHYDTLMKLCEGDSSFYYVDQVLDGLNYRIFSYRLAGYQEFTQPYARECRGHMFEVDQQGNMLRLASMPMEKFFNKDENPFTMNLVFDSVDFILTKEDGSLISTFSHNTGTLGDYDHVYVKSKTSVHSDQALAARKLLHSEKFRTLLETVRFFVDNNYTVNMEYTAPDNRIVVPHQTANLTVLNVRNMINGEYLSYDALRTIMVHKGSIDYLVANHMDTVTDCNEFINSIPDMTGIEGFVIRITYGETVKIKTNWYSALHRAKDSLNSPKALFEVVVSEAHDDLRASFADDPYVLNAIAAMETKVQGIYKQIKINVEDFYHANKHLDRKSYAILGQAECDKKYFGLAMSMYLGKEIDYKEWLIKHYKDFGIKDEVLEAATDG